MAARFIIFSCLLAIAYAIPDLLLNETSEISNNINGTNYVIGGSNAYRGEFPYQISLQVGSPYRSFHTCGGTIIKSKWIVTAGHCVWNSGNRRFIVKAGKTSLGARESTEQISYVSRIFIHHKYRGGVGPFDIALLKLATPFQFNSYVQPMNLPQPNSIPRGSAMLSGWGSISKTTRPLMPDVLQKVALPIIDINSCSQALSRLGAARQLHNSNVCTGPLTGRFNVCSGDSGGPLVMRYSNGARELIGVVSWGFVPCSMYGSPSVFVRVSAFNDWINRIVSYY